MMLRNFWEGTDFFKYGIIDMRYNGLLSWQYDGSIKAVMMWYTMACFNVMSQRGKFLLETIYLAGMGLSGGVDTCDTMAYYMAVL